MNLSDSMMTNNQFWIKEIDNNRYYLGFKNSTIEEIEDLSFIQLSVGEVLADNCFLEVESKKATFEFTLPVTIRIIEDLTDNLQENFKSSEPLAIIEIVK